MEKEALNELRRIRYQLQKNKTNTPTQAGNGCLKVILIGALLLLILIAIVLAILVF